MGTIISELPLTGAKLAGGFMSYLAHQEEGVSTEKDEEVMLAGIKDIGLDLAFALVNKLASKGFNVLSKKIENLVNKSKKTADKADDIADAAKVIDKADDAADTAKVIDKADDVVDNANKTSKGLIGHDFEDYLTKHIGGNGSFSVSGRDFDGGIGNRWWEAKSGQYWNMLDNNPKKLANFKSDMGDRLRIAIENGASYELFSNTPIPDSIKLWLDKKGIKYTEFLD